MSVSDHSLFVKIGERRIGNMGSDNQVFFIGSLKIKRRWRLTSIIVELSC